LMPKSSTIIALKYSWAPHALDRWYLGPVLKHYHFYTISKSPYHQPAT